jgi:murein DD-endopeptidase MepM/ murein hydrolase activator NlpD
MPVRPPAIFLAMALAGCATARLGSPEPVASSPSRLTGRDEGPDVSPPPGPPEVEPAVATTPSGEELRRRLVQFVSEAQAARASALPGDPMPSVQLARWELIQTEVERFLATPASADDLSAVRALVQAVLDLDARVYQDLPGPLLQGLDRRLAILEARFDLASPGAVRQLGYRWPLSTVRVTSRYGKRFHPIKRRWKLHAGVDLAADPNEPVLAAGAGMVVRAGWNAGYGYEVEVQHVDGLLTRYSHLAAPLVLEGTPVQPGDAVGLAGRTGTATGVHLHFEFVRGGVPRDPLKEFRKLVGTPAPRVVILAPQHRRVKKGQDPHAEEPGA